MPETAGLEDFLRWLEPEPPSFTLLAVKAPLGLVTGMLADTHGPRRVSEEVTVSPERAHHRARGRARAESQSESATAEAQSDAAEAESATAQPQSATAEAQSATDSDDPSEAETALIATVPGTSADDPAASGRFGAGSSPSDWLAVVRLRDDPWTFVYGGAGQPPPADERSTPMDEDSPGAAPSLEAQAEDLSTTLGTDALVMRAWSADEDEGGPVVHYEIFSDGERTELAEWSSRGDWRLFESSLRARPDLAPPEDGSADLALLDRMLRDRGIYVPACRLRVHGASAGLSVAGLDPGRIERADLVQLAQETIWPEDETLDLRLEEIRRATGDAGGDSAGADEASSRDSARSAAGSSAAGSPSSGSPSSSPPSSGSSDAVSADAGSPDAGSPDAVSADAVSADAVSADAGSADAGSADAGSSASGPAAGSHRRPEADDRESIGQENQGQESPEPAGASDEEQSGWRKRLRGWLGLPRDRD